jgi:hypothetical protein
MPYVDKDIREALDEDIEKLAMKIRRMEPGVVDGALNYTITRLLLLQYPTHYVHFNRLMGILDSVSHEFYRRVVAPYEDGKRAANGDVFQ